MNKKHIETVKQQVVYENQFVTVYDDLVQFPHGNVGNYFRYRWKAPYGVAILPIYANSALLIDTYRYSELARSIEVPQGFGTHGSTPEADARRELMEECGAAAQNLKFVGVVGRDFKTHLFVTELNDPPLKSRSSPESTEVIHGTIILDSIRLRELIRDGSIYDCVSLYLITMFFNSREFHF